MCYTYYGVGFVMIAVYKTNPLNLAAFYEGS